MRPEGTPRARALAAAAALTLIAGAALAWVGLRSLAERERSVRAHYTVTTILVRDRLIAELARLESELRGDFTRAAAGLGSRTAARRWIAQLLDTRPWLAEPVLFDRSGGALSLDLDAGWQRAAVPPWRDAASSTLIRQAEAAEFSDDLGNALALYRIAYRRSSSASARALTHMRIGRVLYKLRQYEEGIDHYRSVVESMGDVTDPNGIPYAVSALRQLAEGFTALQRTEDRVRAERRLRDYVLDRPWNVADGYEHHLALVRRFDDGPETASTSRIKRLQDDLERIAWIRRELAPRLVTAASAAEMERPLRRQIASRDAFIRWISAGVDGAGHIGMAYELRTSYIAGPMLETVTGTIDLGGNLTVAVFESAEGRRPPLMEADLGIPPGWRVGLFDRDGRSIQQLAARDRVIYGTLIGGMILVLVAGMTFTARASARETELARLRTDFVASVTHELKTPLALIRMFGETLDSGLVHDRQQQREFHGVIRRESERLTHLIDNVLDIARIDAGTKQYSLQDDDLTAVVRQAVETYRPFFVRQGFDVQIALPSVPILLRIDRDAVIQTLINLFQNAIKFAAEAKQVTVSVEKNESDVRLAVADRGVGIAPADLPRIFDRYYRASANGSGAAGSGLGLSLVAHMMAAHGGRVEVESTPGTGSVFTLVFPAGAQS